MYHSSDSELFLDNSNQTTSTSNEVPVSTRQTRSMTHARTTRSNEQNMSTTCTQPLPCVHAPHVGSQRLNGERTREKQEVMSLLYLPRGQWLPARSTNYNRIATRVNNKTTLNSIKSSNPASSDMLPSEIKGFRLLQGTLTYRDANGVTRTGRVKLDTCSNGCYALPQASLPRAWRPWEPRTVQGIEGTLTPLGNPTSFTLYKNGEQVKIDTNDPPPGALPDGCVALLGLDAIHDLGIDIAYAIKHNKHMPIRYLANQEHLVEKRKTDAINKYVKLGYVKDTIVKTCNLSEKVVREYLTHHPNDYESKPLSIEDVDISPALSRKTREKLRILIRLYDTVFANKTNTLPPVLTGVKPHMFKLKENAKPVYETRPSFPPAKAKAITDWLHWGLECGLVEKATNTSYASRLILAPKYKGSTPKTALPDGIRVAWAGVRVNDTIIKTVPTYTDAWQQLYKVANTKYKFSADGLKQYWSIPLSKKAREMTAFWTPEGLFQFTRLVMGTKNAATVAQNAYTHALHHMLNARSFPNIANFADDFLGGADSEESLLQTFEDFLAMCKEANITLNPLKVRIGYEAEQFFGLKIDKGKIEPAERNLDPVKNMEYPKNRSELRSVMGVFNQFTHFLEDYGLAGNPAAVLNSLSSPKAEWEFTEQHRNAVDALKKATLKGIHIYAPNNNFPLILETDGSDDGWGAVLYQQYNDERHVIKMWSKQWKTEAWHKKPPYHKEAKAWMNGMTLAMPYALCNPFPIQCWTDHSPLTWVKHTSGKGPVSQFIIDTLSQVDYEMNYIKGEQNNVADALSRFPMLGPQKLRRSGLANALNVLLSTILQSDINTSKIWFNAQKDTRYLLPNIYDWCEARKKANSPGHSPIKHCYQDAFSESKIPKLKYSLGIWAPPADRICRQARQALTQNTPFALLMPSDLIDHICVDINGKLLPDIQAKVEKTHKICFLSAQLTWIIHGINIKGQYKNVYVNNRVTPEIDLQQLMRNLKDSNLTPPLPDHRSRQDWIDEQVRHRTSALWAHEPRVGPAQDGLLMYRSPQNDTLLTVVPEPLQTPLIEWKHKQMCHMSTKKVYNELKKKFFFNNMHQKCKQVVDDCALCNLLKARKNHAHKHFRAKLYCTPRTSYGADYYSVKKNKLGYDNVLGIIDLSTGNLVLRAVQGRTAANTAHTLFYDVIVHKGIPLQFHSDAAKEFLSTAMSTLQTLLGIRKTDTLAHNPKSNAKIERVWEFVGRALRAMPPDQYAQFHLYMPIIAHVWNCTPDVDTGITPFEAEHGMSCRSVAESLIQNPPTEGLPASADDLSTIATAASAFNEIIGNIKAVERSRAAAKLNVYGQPLREFSVGDRVTFYLPPNQGEAEKMGKNPKHMLQYQGPGIITEALSDNNTSFAITYNNRTYKRNIMHMSRYTSEKYVPPNVRMYIDNTHNVGSFVAVLDAAGDNHYHIAKILSIDEHTTRIHYYATYGARLRSATWKPLYLLPHTNQIVMRQPDTIGRNQTKWTGVIDTKPTGEGLIILANIGMTAAMKINSRAYKILHTMNDYSHHVLTRTWMQNNEI